MVGEGFAEEGVDRVEGVPDLAALNGAARGIAGGRMCVVEAWGALLVERDAGVKLREETEEMVLDDFDVGVDDWEAKGAEGILSACQKYKRETGARLCDEVLYL